MLELLRSSCARLGEDDKERALVLEVVGGRGPPPAAGMGDEEAVIAAINNVDGDVVVLVLVLAACSAPRRAWISIPLAIGAFSADTISRQKPTIPAIEPNMILWKASWLSIQQAASGEVTTIEHEWAMGIPNTDPKTAPEPYLAPSYICVVRLCRNLPMAFPTVARVASMLPVEVPRKVPVDRALLMVLWVRSVGWSRTGEAYPVKTLVLLSIRAPPDAVATPSPSTPPYSSSLLSEGIGNDFTGAVVEVGGVVLAAERRREDGQLRL